MNRQPLALPQSIHPLVRGGLDAHLAGVDSKDPSDAGTDGRYVRHDLRALPDEHEVHVADLPAQRGYLGNRPTRDHRGIHALEGSVSVGEIVPDVPQASRSQNRVGNRVQEDIRIRMPIRTNLRRNAHPTQDTRTASHQGMDVVTESDAERGLGHAPF